MLLRAGEVTWRRVWQGADRRRLQVEPLLRCEDAVLGRRHASEDERCHGVVLRHPLRHSGTETVKSPGGGASRGVVDQFAYAVSAVSV